MLFRAVAASILIGIAAAAGCNDGLAPRDCGGATCHAERTVTDTFQSTNNPDVDVLFVIDDGMAAALSPPVAAGSYGSFAEVLQSLTPNGIGTVPPGQTPPSLHVGFVPSSYAGGDDCVSPATRATACGLPPADQFLSTAPCGRQPNFMGAFEDVFSCMANVGNNACGRPQLLASMRRALGGDAGGGALTGTTPFLRSDAVLQIVIVAARDDASGSAPALEDVASFAAFLRTLKADPAQIVVSVIGPGDCATLAPPTASAPRLTAMSEAFGGHGLYIRSCDSSPQAAFLLLAARSAVLKVSCLDGVRDNDAAMDGVQASCAVEDSNQPIDGFRESTALPSCDGSPPPCWRLTADPSCSGTALRVQIDRGPDFCPWLSTETRVSCVAN